MSCARQEHARSTAAIRRISLSKLYHVANSFDQCRRLHIRLRPTVTRCSRGLFVSCLFLVSCALVSCFSFCCMHFCFFFCFSNPRILENPCPQLLASFARRRSFCECASFVRFSFSCVFFYCIVSTILFLLTGLCVYVCCFVVDLVWSWYLCFLYFPPSSCFR